MSFKCVVVEVMLGMISESSSCHLWTYNQSSRKTNTWELRTECWLSFLKKIAKVEGVKDHGTFTARRQESASNSLELCIFVLSFISC
jgi:hypothetical protein